MPKRHVETITLRNIRTLDNQNSNQEGEKKKLAQTLKKRLTLPRPSLSHTHTHCLPCKSYRCVIYFSLSVFGDSRSNTLHVDALTPSRDSSRRVSRVGKKNQLLLGPTNSCLAPRFVLVPSSVYSLFTSLHFTSFTYPPLDSTPIAEKLAVGRRVNHREGS